MKLCFSLFCIAFLTLINPVLADDAYQVNGVMDGDVLNVRQQPNADAALVGSIPHNGKGIRKVNCIDGKSIWCYVTYKGIDGWVNSSFLKPQSANQEISTDEGSNLEVSDDPYFPHDSSLSHDESQAMEFLYMSYGFYQVISTYYEVTIYITPDQMKRAKQDIQSIENTLCREFPFLKGRKDDLWSGATQHYQQLIAAIRTYGSSEYNPNAQDDADNFIILLRQAHDSILPNTVDKDF